MVEELFKDFNTQSAEQWNSILPQHKSSMRQMSQLRIMWDVLILSARRNEPKNRALRQRLEQCLLSIATP